MLTNAHCTEETWKLSALSLHRTPIKTLKRVSGQLRGLLRRHHSTDPEPSERHNLLIVDDEESICSSMKDYFSHTGFAVDTAVDIDEAERLIEAGKYEVLIQDIRMGIMRDFSGMEVIKFARTRRPEMRIVVLTAHGTREVENEARFLGVDAFLRKPQPLAHVAHVVRGLLAASGQRIPSDSH